MKSYFCSTCIMTSYPSTTMTSKVFSVAHVLFLAGNCDSSSYFREQVTLSSVCTWHDPNVHDIHYKSIMDWVILFSFLPVLLSPFPSLVFLRYGNKSFWNDLIELYDSLSNKASSTSSLSLSARGKEKESLIMKKLRYKASLLFSVLANYQSSSRLKKHISYVLPFIKRVLLFEW